MRPAHAPPLKRGASEQVERHHLPDDPLDVAEPDRAGLTGAYQPGFPRTWDVPAQSRKLVWHRRSPNQPGPAAAPTNWSDHHTGTNRCAVSPLHPRALLCRPPGDGPYLAAQNSQNVPNANSAQPLRHVSAPQPPSGKARWRCQRETDDELLGVDARLSAVAVAAADADKNYSSPYGSARTRQTDHGVNASALAPTRRAALSCWEPMSADHRRWWRMIAPPQGAAAPQDSLPRHRVRACAEPRTARRPSGRGCAVRGRHAFRPPPSERGPA